MIRITFIIILIIPILACGKKGSLEYPLDEAQTSDRNIRNIIYS